MAKYIRQEAAEKIFSRARTALKPEDYKSADEFNTRDLMLLNAEQLIHAMKSIDVVLCKDCLYCHAGYCDRFDDLIPFGFSNEEWENWYCADGVRKERNNG